METDAETFRRIFARELSAEEALAQGLARLEGEPAAIANFFAIVVAGGPREG